MPRHPRIARRQVDGMAIPLEAARPALNLREHSLLRVSDSSAKSSHLSQGGAMRAGSSSSLREGGERECLLSFLVTVIPKNNSPLVYLD